MTILFLILIILASVILAFFVLVQNPKGGGLAGNIAGFSNQFMGVKQTTDVLEKGTWILAGALAVLCLVSVLFISGIKSSSNDGLDKLNPGAARQSMPAPPAAGGNNANTVTIPDSTGK